MSLTYSGLGLRTPLPASVKVPSAEGLRRGSKYNTGTGDWEGDAIWMDWTGGGIVTLAANTYGVQVTVDTIPGETYTLQGGVMLNYSSNPARDAGAHTFALTRGSIKGPALTIINRQGTGFFTPMEFVAEAETTTVGVIITHEVSGNVGSELARVGLYAMSLTQKNFEYPQTLRNTVYSSSLANHFDLACNSINATWHVDTSGVAQFIPPAKYLPISFVFSDDAGNEFLEYIDLEPQHATSSIINKVEVTNLGIGGDGNESSPVTTYEDAASISKYGERKESLTVNVNTWQGHAPSLSALMSDLMANRAEPRLAIAKVVWNAQQDLQAAMRLELGQRVAVRFRGQEYDAQIAYLQHDITPTRWLITITLRLP